MTLEMRNISVNLSDRPVLCDISAEFTPGQIVAICGPNGVGKSTLLKSLAGLLPLAEGAIACDSSDLADYSPRLRAQMIGYLPQSGEIAWDVAVENLVALGRMPYRDRGTQAIEAAIAALDLETLRHRPASKLSGGEKSRALLARVFAGEPRWILADEPFATLDLAHQHSLISYFKQSAKGGQGVVLVMHDLNLAMNHADRVLVLGPGEDGGALTAEGPPEKALTAEVIANVWGVKAHWIGEPGARALVTKD